MLCQASLCDPRAWQRVVSGSEAVSCGFEQFIQLPISREPEDLSAG